ncbi:MAG: type II secretion system F family protein [Oligoflexia bacterium]|nr:type II secretion system F family protein [Oligoflexia bacterium]
MPLFKWEGIDKKGKRIAGEDDANNDRDLRRKLKGRNIRPLKIRYPTIFEMDFGIWLVEKGLASPFSRKELINFTKQLSVMINSGVPILHALEVIYKQEKNPSMKVSIKKIAMNVSAGKSLSDSMKLEVGFDNLYCNLVKAGETGGVLDTILEKLAIYLDKQEKTLSQVKSALTYPIILIVVGILVVALLLVFVVPKFVEMLHSSGQETPFITQLLIDISAFLGTWWLVIIAVVVAWLMIFLKWKKTDIGKTIWDAFIMGTPLFGNLVIKSDLSSLTRTLSTMLSSGVSLIDSLEICSNVVDNKVIAKDIKGIKKSVEEGKTLVDSMVKIRYIPDIVLQLIKVGEQTGNLDNMFERISDIFDRETDDAIGIMTKMLEPIILLLLGGVIGGILVALYLPIFLSAGGQG